MLQTGIAIFFACWIALIPIYLWGYGVSTLLDDRWNRSRFFLGILLGSFAVSLSYLFAMSTVQGIVVELLASLGLLSILLTGVLLLTWRGSRYARGFLQKIAITHTIVFASVFLMVFGVAWLIPSLRVLVPLVGVVLLTPLIEEATKHLGSVGLASHEFRFGQREIIAFSFFVVLGFVFAENLLYLIRGDFSLGIWIWRSLFTLVAHAFTTLLIAHFWWRALAYPIGSVPYIGRIVGGFVIAGALHVEYNYFLAQGSLLGLLLYAGVGYLVYVFSYKKAEE